MRDFRLPPPLWSIASYIHLSMAVKAGLALATIFWTHMSASQSFLAIRPGSWCVHALGQSRLARPRLQRVRCGSSDMHTRTLAFSPRSGSVQVSSTGVVRKNGLSACGAFSDHAQRLKPALAVSAGEHHTCAVWTDGQLICFGLRRCDVPTDLGPVLAVAAGARHICAVRTDGQLVCFGNTGWGRCDVPTDLGPVLAVSAGGLHTCAVRTDGQLVCFGSNLFGQCDVPTDLGPVSAVSAGGHHTCAVRTDGQLVCFGITHCGP